MRPMKALTLGWIVAALLCWPTLAEAQIIQLPRIPTKDGSSVTAQASILSDQAGAEKGIMSNPLIVGCVNASNVRSDCAGGAGGGGGGGGDPTSTGTVGSATAPTTVSMAGLYDGTNVRRWLGDNAGRAWVNVNTLPAITGSVGLTGNLPSFGTTPTFNLGTAPSLTIGASALPTGAATASGVSAVVTALGSPYQAGGALPLPSGAATASGVAAVVTALGAPLQAGGMVTANLGSLNGAATEATLAKVAAGTKAVSTFAAMAVGTTYTPGIGVAAVCTAAGNIILQAADGSQITVPVVAGFNQYGFAIAKVVSQTATCTFTNLS